MEKNIGKLLCGAALTLSAFTIAHGGELNDPRDGKVYKTVQLGNQEWMAENLKFVNEGSMCLDGEEKYCETYLGRLYTGVAAKTACPAGWHLPSENEFEMWMSYAGGEEISPKKSKKITGWRWRPKNRTDKQTKKDEIGYLWTSTADEEHQNSSYIMWLDYTRREAIFESATLDSVWNSVRCVKNAAPDELVDTRDDQVYKTVKIGNQQWMAENLRYAAEGSQCFEFDETNCKDEGRYYNFETALTVCPAGWHLPSAAEYETLIKTAGGTEIAGNNLKSTSGWQWRSRTFNGTDSLGFSGKPLGFHDTDFHKDRDKKKQFRYRDYRVFYWTSEQDEHGGAKILDLSERPTADIGGIYKSAGIFVRCLKDAK